MHVRLAPVVGEFGQFLELRRHAVQQRLAVVGQRDAAVLLLQFHEGVVAEAADVPVVDEVLETEVAEHELEAPVDQRFELLECVLFDAHEAVLVAAAAALEVEQNAVAVDRLDVRQHLAEEGVLVVQSCGLRLVGELGFQRWDLTRWALVD